MQRSGSGNDPLFASSHAHEHSSPRSNPVAEPSGRMGSEQLPDRHAEGKPNGQQRKGPDGSAPQEGAGNRREGAEWQGNGGPHIHDAGAPSGASGEASAGTSGRMDSGQRAEPRNGDAAGPALPGTAGRTASNGQRGSQHGDEQAGQGQAPGTKSTAVERTSQRGDNRERGDQGQAAGAKGEDLGPSKEVAFDLGVQWEGSQDVSIAITLLPRRLGLATLLVQVMSALLKLKVRGSACTAQPGRMQCIYLVCMREVVVEVQHQMRKRSLMREESVLLNAVCERRLRAALCSLCKG